MKYYKIKASFYGVPQKLYRIMYIREDQDLLHTCAAILNTLNVTYEHMFIARDKENTYCHPSWIEEWIDFKSFVDVDLKDLILYSNNTFKLIYDTGENWEFDCKIYKRMVELENDAKKYILVDSMGQGIFEDDMETYFLYVTGQITNDDLTDIENLGGKSIEYYLPFNLYLDKLEDSDEPLDNDEYNIDLDEMVDEDIKYILGE